MEVKTEREEAVEEPPPEDQNPKLLTQRIFQMVRSYAVHGAKLELRNKCEDFLEADSESFMPEEAQLKKLCEALVSVGRPDGDVDPLLKMKMIMGFREESVSVEEAVRRVEKLTNDPMGFSRAALDAARKQVFRSVKQLKDRSWFGMEMSPNRLAEVRHIEDDSADAYKGFDGWKGQLETAARVDLEVDMLIPFVGKVQHSKAFIQASSDMYSILR